MSSCVILNILRGINLGEAEAAVEARKKEEVEVFAQKEQEVLEEWKRQYQVERKNEMEAGMEECTRNPFNGQKTSRESTHRTEDLAEKCTKNPFNGQKTSRESTHRPEDLMENVQKNPFNGQKTSRESTHRPEDLMEKFVKRKGFSQVLDVHA